MGRHEHAKLLLLRLQQLPPAIRRTHLTAKAPTEVVAGPQPNGTTQCLMDCKASETTISK